LANAEYDGDRFLIFGIEDCSMKAAGVSTDKNRRTQADILDFLRSHQSKFAEGRYPSIRLETIKIDNSEIDVLIVPEMVKKPIYLVKQIHGVRPYHIYSREQDANTPKNESASPHDIERMWRERFGLNQPALKRAKTLLTPFNDWECDTQDTGDALWFHKVFPEFTIRMEDCDFDCNQEWTRGEIVKDHNRANVYSIYYHQTRMARVHRVSFDDHKKSMVAPDWEACNAGRFYYYERDRIKFSMHLFNAHYSDRDHSKGLRTNSESINIPVVTSDEVKRFLKVYNSFETSDVCRDTDKQNAIFLNNQLAFIEWRNANGGEQDVIL
jgi:hypothetical protein